LTIRALIIVVIGCVAFVIIDNVITSIIVGTDTGSKLLQNLLRLIVAAVILVSAVMGIGKAG